MVPRVAFSSHVSLMLEQNEPSPTPHAVCKLHDGGLAIRIPQSKSSLKILESSTRSVIKWATHQGRLTPQLFLRCTRPPNDISFQAKSSKQTINLLFTSSSVTGWDQLRNFTFPLRNATYLPRLPYTHVLQVLDVATPRLCRIEVRQ